MVGYLIVLSSILRLGMVDTLVALGCLTHKRIDQTWEESRLDGYVFAEVEGAKNRRMESKHRLDDTTNVKAPACAGQETRLDREKGGWAQHWGDNQYR